MVTPPTLDHSRQTVSGILSNRAVLVFCAAKGKKKKNLWYVIGSLGYVKG